MLAIMVEVGFLSNLNECKFLIDDGQQNKIANTLLEFIAELNYTLLIIIIEGRLMSAFLF